MGVRASDNERSSPTATGLEPSERHVGKYRILSELGRGGTATAYLAVARGQGVHKLVVLKALLPEFAADPVALSMFLDEARLAAQLNHANIVQTYEIGSEGGRNVIVMEYLEGQSLSRILRYGERSGEPMPIAMQLRILATALEGLHYAHELPGYDGTPLLLVHRDVSPQNVFVTYDGQVKLLDFGIAQAVTSSDPGAGLIKGKIAYMAPEQMLGESVDRRADVFSVGCMLWAVAAGSKLWNDTPEAQIVRRVTRGEIPSPKSVNPHCPEELERITLRALAFDPGERYATALDMQTDIERYAEALTPIKQREIGRFVSHLFSSARAKLRDSIERQVAPLAAEDSAEYSLTGMRVPSDTSELRLIDRARDRSTVRIAAPQRRWLRWLGAPLLLILVGVFTWFATYEPVPRSGTKTLSEVRAARPATGPATAEPHAVHLPSAAPEPQPQPTVRAVAKFPGGLRQRRLAAPASAAAALPSAEATPRATPRTPSCDTPFFLDAEGIKRVRPECL